HHCRRRNADIHQSEQHVDRRWCVAKGARHCWQLLSVQVLMDAAMRISGIALVLDGESAAARYEMPVEREGDFVVIGDTHTAIGSRPDEHDLAGLNGKKLRSHGGLSEQPVPFMLSRPLNAAYRTVATSRRLRNFDIFDFALNGAA